MNQRPQKIKMSKNRQITRAILTPSNRLNKSGRSLLKEEHKLKGKDLEKILREEMKVQKKIFKLKAKDREAKQLSFHHDFAKARVKALKQCKSYEYGKKTSVHLMNKLAEDYELWF